MGILSRASLHPPENGGGGGADLANGPRPSWILLDQKAYVADARNSTTATCRFKGDKELQVTFFPARPPRVSYFCVFCAGHEASDYALEPKIVGILSHDGYTVVALRDDSIALYRKSPPGPGHYEVCILRSKDTGWTIKDVYVPPEQQQQQRSGDDGGRFRHATYKTITIGAERGTVAFVDLWRGILWYDVFGGSPLLRYTLLPDICPGTKKQYNVNPLYTRDIAVVEGRIKFVAMVNPRTMGSTGSACYWKAATWSMPASSSSSTSSREDNTWLPPFELEACDIGDNKNLVCSELLPKLHCREGKPRPTLASLDTEYPMLSLCDDDIVYFMTRVALPDTKACMIAVDMKSRKLEGLAEFSAERMLDMAFACMHSRISSYLNMAPGMRKTKTEKGMKKEKCKKVIIQFVGLPVRPSF
ncbi:hypothetical protein EJB05_23859, partial [Eragrostis curvula]